MRRLATFLLPVLIIVSLWTWRNYRVFGVFVPFSTGSGAVLWGGNNPVAFAQARGDWINPDRLPDWPQFIGLDEVSQDRALTARALAYLYTVPLPMLVINEAAKVSALWGIFEGTRMKWPVIMFLTAAAARLALSLYLSWRRR
jgi:hypothetical protein